MHNFDELYLFRKYVLSYYNYVLSYYDYVLSHFWIKSEYRRITHFHPKACPAELAVDFFLYSLQAAIQVCYIWRETVMKSIKCSTELLNDPLRC